ncbi:hypothetical protein [Herbaspirillum autotrophicum]|uniref:hypothetical protein n=1 Tax=Herbaspirillum autotrophicum TaxID=180195 RepID=UPI00067E37A0|nr:hypothetical protein [Herbaspirillum autotrophicum]
MKVSVIRTRIRGVLVPKRAWARESTYDGDLAISVTRDNRLNRLTKTARLTRGENERLLELLDVNLEWVNEERLVLTGFEAHTEAGQIIDYAQSWLCLVGAGRRLKSEQDQYEEERFRVAHGPRLAKSDSR